MLQYSDDGGNQEEEGSLLCLLRSFIWQYSRSLLMIYFYFYKTAFDNV